MSPATALDEAPLVAAARAGDEDAFRRLTDPYARQLHVHCYRMLGSLQDAEDAHQETLLRAWRHIASFQARSSFRAWLYRIATNACLSAAGRRQPGAETVTHDVSTPEGDAITLSPYPNALLDELPSAAEPGARYDLEESVQLAFLAAVQLLSPRQRAVLLLRDVLGFAATEVADLIGASPTSVHSTLRRARATLAKRQEAGLLDPDRSSAPDDLQRSLVRRYMDAWHSVDIDGLVALMREDAVMTMPPEPILFRGREAIGEFFASVPAGGALNEVRLVPTRANCQPAVAAYVLDRDAGVHRPYGLMVLTLDGASIAEITGFVDPELFQLFGLPRELET